MYMKKKANAFRSPLVFDEEDEKLKSLDSVQMALVELYAYEMQSVDAIERMTDVDSSYIGSWIAQIKFILSGEAVALENTADEAKAAVAMIIFQMRYMKIHMKIQTMIMNSMMNRMMSQKNTAMNMMSRRL